ncbi:MAG: hypothetical protein VKJ46_09435 [Leptolyngbyaceae bacterium]|nr:hypothetical protein [Leptolyngbyaceae bacterium]
MPVVQKTRKGRYALVFLNQEDVIRYRQQLAEIYQAAQADFAIAAMPIHRIEQLLNLEKLKAYIIPNGMTLQAELDYSPI